MFLSATYLCYGCRLVTLGSKRLPQAVDATFHLSPSLPAIRPPGAIGNASRRPSTLAAIHGAC